MFLSFFSFSVHFYTSLWVFVHRSINPFPSTLTLYSLSLRLLWVSLSLLPSVKTWGRCLDVARQTMECWDRETSLETITSSSWAPTLHLSLLPIPNPSSRHPGFILYHKRYTFSYYSTCLICQCMDRSRRLLQATVPLSYSTPEAKSY